MNFVIFWPQILWKCIDSGYLVGATPYTTSCLSLCNFAHLFFHGLKICMWFGFNPAVNFCHFSILITLSFFTGATSTSPKFDLYLCNDQQDWEEPGHLKFLNALQEDAGNNFPYLVPMNHVNRGGGTIYPGVKCPPLNPHACFHFYVMIKGIEKSLVIWSFWMPFKRILETISHILSLSQWGGGGDTLPRAKVTPHPSTLMYAFIFMLW